MLIAFFDAKGLIHMEFLPEGQTVNGSFYLEVMKRFLATIRRVRRELCKNGEWFLLQDNAPAHTAAIVSRFLAKK